MRIHDIVYGVFIVLEFCLPVLDFFAFFISVSPAIAL